MSALRRLLSLSSPDTTARMKRTLLLMRSRSASALCNSHGGGEAGEK